MLHGHGAADIKDKVRYEGGQVPTLSSAFQCIMSPIVKSKYLYITVYQIYISFSKFMNVLYQIESFVQVEAALLQTYACGSIQAFCHLLSLNENTLSSHTITHTRPDFIESAEPQDITHIHFDIKPDLNEE